ncbi:HAD family hydrolase [Pseudomonas sp. B21-040]|uniref:HAD family hydrolase n=1 Tax=Pseudomonas sp. B21-040 TaxID=2895486 RepID=UPI00215F97FC|nr:HAD family hydrolase [Pseudomonas sp. B21-040]UVL40426.1 HAD family hydrolase [Pseudomonas sp. B21-040]
MTVLAAIFDAFGTLVKIGEGTHPYRKILKLGIEQGRRPQSTDAESLLTLPLDLREAAGFFGIHVDPQVMAEIECDLAAELAEIQAFPDGLSAVQMLQDAGVKVVVCSNLAKPYAAAIERLYPGLDGYSYSFDVGAVKPSFEIYRHAVQLVSVSPADAWMIGDSERCDCEGPTAFGMHGLWLDRQGNSTYTSLHQFTKAILSTRY